MRPVVVVVTDIIAEQSFQMGLVLSYHVVEKFTATASGPTLRHFILPRASNRRLYGCYFQIANGGRHFESVFGIMIEQQEFGTFGKGEGFSKLLGNPDAGRVLHDIDVDLVGPVIWLIRNARCLPSPDTNNATSLAF